MPICVEFELEFTKVGFGACHWSTQTFFCTEEYVRVISLSNFSHPLSLSMLFGSRSITVTDSGLISCWGGIPGRRKSIRTMMLQSLNVAERRYARR